MIGLHGHHMSYSPAAQSGRRAQADSGGAAEPSSRRAPSSKRQDDDRTIGQFRSGNERLLLEQATAASSGGRRARAGSGFQSAHFVQVPAQTHGLSNGAMVLVVPNCRKSRAHPMGTVSGLGQSSREQRPLELATSLRSQFGTGPLQPYAGGDQVLLIVEDDQSRGAGIPIIGRRVASKSAAEVAPRELAMEAPRQQQQPQRGLVMGRRSHRMLAAQQQRLQPLSLELPEASAATRDECSKRRASSRATATAASVGCESTPACCLAAAAAAEASCCAPPAPEPCMLPCCSLDTGARRSARSQSASNLAPSERVKLQRRQRRRLEQQQQRERQLTEQALSHDSLLFAAGQPLGRARSCHSAQRARPAAPPVPSKPRAAGHLLYPVGSPSPAPSDAQVTQMYESLAAELKAKLGDPRAAPILLPPKDYDTLSRRQGKLTGIELRRSTNPQLVGPAQRGAPASQTAQAGKSTSASPVGSSSLDSARSSARSSDRLESGNQGAELRVARGNAYAPGQLRSRSNSSSGLGSISLGARSSPSAVSSTSDDLELTKMSPLDAPASGRLSPCQGQPRGKGIENHNPSNVSNGVLWNGRVEIPLKVNSERRHGQTFLATKQIIY